MSQNANFGASRYQKMLMDGPPHIIFTTPQELNVPNESSNPLEDAAELRLQSAHDLAGSHVPMEDKGKKDWMPELGMKFESEEQAYEFYNRYAVVDVYTPVIYEMFQKEYVESLDCVVRRCNEVGATTEYKVTVVEKTHEKNVTFNSLNGTILCSCKKFEFIGILCSHALKILDLRNIKVLPPQYILKRWTKDAKSGSIADGLPSHDINLAALLVNNSGNICFRFQIQHHQLSPLTFGQKYESLAFTNTFSNA
ncbi:hypothetical protein NE237_030486 [Protea cynaroides]|uniref:Protein FAR1-RELATED SEQUENCE n=1 Tax=Protea cynaroides TaxID=273540 RepID=A0A9Q0GU74_9MAGN|nr:hypothetical protein NE237_030486 [Protea cynaroides]